MRSKYSFTDYNPEWPGEFELEAARLRSLLGDEVIAIYHIGSTSVPGLAAKSVIDLLPTVREIARIDELTPVLEQAGYHAWGEYGIPERRYFSKDHGEYRTHNVHIFQAGSPEIERHLAFIEYLKSHEQVRLEYADLKREVFAREVFERQAEDMSTYNDGKNAWIKRTERLALEWYRQQANYPQGDAHEPG
jgi:GrpB-like predicted nucleotidyltransferase (UPF0157 family)